MLPLVSIFAALSLISFIHAKAAAGSDDNPKLVLPWGTYVSEPYDEDRFINVFKNVRFGKAPVDSLRFARSEYPDAIEDKTQIQNNSFGPSCVQANLKADTPSPLPGGAEDEDCLFLDIYLPFAAQDYEDKLPVVVSIFGGAYIFGGKDTVIATEDETQWSLYDGTGIMDASDNGVIWVVANYRLGAYGWLAGETVEQHGSPNAALYDQRLVFQFVQDFISQVNGDKDTVSAWGNSAGAGSIIHHLTAFQGSQAPLFSRAVLWSPTYQWAWDRHGALENTYKTLATAAGCGERLGNLDCLRGVDNTTLKAANQEVVNKATDVGLFPFGPAVDGSWVKALPAQQLALGQTANLSSLIVSHVWNEAEIFVRPWVKTTKDFKEFLNLAFPGKNLQEIRDGIETSYPAAGAPFDGNQQERLRKVLEDSIFVCNARQLYEAYKGKTYMLQYQMPPGTHGSDLLASTWHNGADVRGLINSFQKGLVPGAIAEILESVIPPFASRYQRYFASHALFGDPNQLNNRLMTTWDIAKDDGDTIDNALTANLLFSGTQAFFKTDPDPETTATNCDFWTNLAAKINKVSKAAEKSEGGSGEYDDLFGSHIQEPIANILDRPEL